MNAGPAGRMMTPDHQHLVPLTNRHDDFYGQFDGRPPSVIAILSAFDGHNAPLTCR